MMTGLEIIYSFCGIRSSVYLFPETIALYQGKTHEETGENFLKKNYPSALLISVKFYN